jgi:signal peptidase I
MSTTWKARLLRIWRHYVLPMTFVVVVLLAFRSSIADWNDVPSGSMKPSIIEGDRIFVNKLAYDLKVPFTSWRLARWAQPKRGDIVIFYSPADGQRLVKRVVGVPGDTVEMVNDYLTINGKTAEYGPLSEAVVDQVAAAERGEYVFANERIGQQEHPVMVTPGMRAMRTFGPIRVPEGQFFMMGDNRDNSADSRYFGTVDGKLIVGRASRVLVSVDLNDYFLPRWGRFFKLLP